MKRVLVVEDDKNISALLLQYIAEVDREIECTLFSKAGDAYQFAADNAVHLFIIDIQLVDYKGTSLAKQLRGLPQYKFTPIVFATALASEELGMYRDVKCHSFLVKPFTKDEFIKAFCDALEMGSLMNGPVKRLRIEQKQFIFEYEVSSIVYMESFGKRIVIHTKNSDGTLGQDTISGYSLIKLLQLLSEDNFIQCHKSYLVNRSCIRKVDKQNMAITLMNGQTIPFGEKYRTNL